MTGPSRFVNSRHLKSFATFATLVAICSAPSATQAAQTSEAGGAIVSTTSDTKIVSSPDIALSFNDTVSATAEAPKPEPTPEATPQAASRSATRTTVSSGASGSVSTTDTTSTVSMTDTVGQSLGAEAVAVARQYLGIPYVWAGSSPSEGFDCSGLVQYVYAQLGVSMPRNSETQAAAYPVTTSPVPGDLVHYSGHIGIYIGNGMMIHAPKPGDVVKIASVYGSPTYHHVS